MTGQAYRAQSAPDLPAVSSGAWIAFGILCTVGAGILFVTGAQASTSADAPLFALIVFLLAAGLGISGQIMLAIGVIAKGVKLGNRESRLS